MIKNKFKAYRCLIIISIVGSVLVGMNYILTRIFFTKIAFIISSIGV